MVVVCRCRHGFRADCLSQLIDAADSVARPVVGALCFGLRKGDEDPELQTFDFLTFPTQYQWEEREDAAGFRIVPDDPPDELVPVAATGAACVVAHRDLLGKIRAEYGDRWFDRIDHPKGAGFSEVLSFFVRVAGVDAPAYVHTGSRHHTRRGGIYLREYEFRRQQARQETCR